MDYKIPATSRPEEISRLFEQLSNQPVPSGEVAASLLKNWGFSAASAKQLLEILRKLEFIDLKDQASSLWRQFADDQNRGSLLAASLKQAYPDLFKNYLCPYLEDDDTLAEYFRDILKISPKDIESVLRTFRNLAERADFQDLLSEEGAMAMQAGKQKAECTEASIKVNPNLQLNIQIHIDPQTSDEKIATIFKNMQKYILKANTQD